MLDFLSDLERLSGSTALLRLILAMLMGAALGLERSRKLRPAGLRTYMLVCIGACATMLSGLFLFEQYGPGFDPARMAAQVVSGIGFIGAGTIMVTPKHRVKGLTTAAGVWAVACLGIAIGGGFYSIAAGAFVLLLITMLFADKLELIYYTSLKRFSVGIIISSMEVIKQISCELGEQGILLTAVEFTDSVAYEGIAFSCMLRMEKRMVHHEIIDKIMEMDGVIFVERLDI